MPETGTFLSRDLVESEPSYLYVRGNPINFTEFSGFSERYPGVCETWSYPLRLRCQVANNSSLGFVSLYAIEELYRVIVWGDRLYLGWYVAADLLDRYLDGSGEPYIIYDREWVLSTDDDIQARETLISRFVNEHLKPAVASCRPSPILAHLAESEIDPPGSTEVKNSLGEHTMQAYFEAWVDGESTFFADVTVNFVIDDYYDFDPARFIESPVIARVGVGRVPHKWLTDLVAEGWAAEFDLDARWNEDLTIQGSTSSIMYRVDRSK
jgi:hypothetical protein